jgi:hypothetical protein
VKKRSPKKILPLTKQDFETREKYFQAKHKQGGDLHERMKWLVGCKESLREYVHGTKDVELFTLVQALGFAVLDLETELAYHEPAIPAFTRRDPMGLQWPHIQHHKNPTPKEETVIKLADQKTKKSIEKKQPLARKKLQK